MTKLNSSFQINIWATERRWLTV